MPTVSAIQHIVATPGVAGGKPRIDGHRIKVQDVVIWHERLGMSVDAIAAEYDLTPAQIHAALAYYFGQSVRDRWLDRCRPRVAKSMQRQTPSKLSDRLMQASRTDD